MAVAGADRPTDWADRPTPHFCSCFLENLQNLKLIETYAYMYKGIGISWKYTHKQSEYTYKQSLTHVNSHLHKQFKELLNNYNMKHLGPVGPMGPITNLNKKYVWGQPQKSEMVIGESTRGPNKEGSLRRAKIAVSRVLFTFRMRFRRPPWPPTRTTRFQLPDCCALTGRISRG